MIGYVDHIGMHAIVGWAEPDPQSARPRTVQALFRGKVIGRATASAPRPDVGTVTRGNPNCGFVIEIDPPYDVDEIDVVADGTILPRAQQASENAAFVHHKTVRKAAPLAEHMLRLTNPQSTPRDAEICERLIATYRTLLSERDTVFAGHTSMWSHLVRRNYRHLARMVAEGRPRELCDYLLHVHKRPETWGISQGPESYYLLRNALPGSAIHKAHSTLYARELLSLAEYLGIVPVENPDQGRVHDAVDLGAVVRTLRARIGIEPIFPHSAGGLFCVDTGEGLVQQRDIWALYSALRIADLLPNLSTRRICEIGGGLGQLCHYARLLGVSQYVLIDLPHVSLLQAFLLMRANPRSRIALFDGGAFDVDADICIYPTFMYQRAPDGYFDLTVNVDSMPEMGWDNASSYARAAARTSARFLSINQEARGPLGVGSARQINATEVLGEIPAFRQAYRFRSWVRRGYVESYFIADAARDAAGNASAARVNAA